MLISKSDPRGSAFGLQGSSARQSTRVVYWKYKLDHKKGLMRFLAGYDAALEPRYEMEPTKIAEYLNEWKTRYTGQRTGIEQGTGLNRNLTVKDVVLLIGIAVLIVAAFVAMAFVLSGM